MMTTAEKKSPEKRGAAARRYVVGISGASGAVYATRLVESMLRDPEIEIDLVASTAGLRVLRGELEPATGKKAGRERTSGTSSLSRRVDPRRQDSKAAEKVPDPFSRTGERLLDYFDLTTAQRGRVNVIPGADIGAGPASGTYRTAGMIVVPCSMNTVACIASGIQNNLLTRAAAVTLKEGRPLLLVPRETPLGLVELRALTTAAEAGAIVLPANPGFYHRPKSVDDLVNFVVQKIMDRLGLEYPGGVRWSGEKA